MLKPFVSDIVGEIQRLRISQDEKSLGILSCCRSAECLFKTMAETLRIKREFFIVLMVLILVIVLIIGLLLWGMQDVTVLERPIDDSNILRVRARGWWEGCVPVYLKVSRKEGTPLISGTFDCFSQQDIESKTLELEIHDVNGIIFIHPEGMPNWILAMLYLEDDLIYPPRGGDNYNEIKFYYARVEHLFSSLKILLKNDELELRR